MSGSSEFPRGEIVSIDPRNFSGRIRIDGERREIFFRWNTRRTAELSEGRVVFGSASSHNKVPAPKVGIRIICVIGEDSRDRPKIERYALEADWDSQAREVQSS